MRTFDMVRAGENVAVDVTAPTASAGVDVGVEGGDVDVSSAAGVLAEMAAADKGDSSASPKRRGSGRFIPGFSRLFGSGSKKHVSCVFVLDGIVGF